LIGTGDAPDRSGRPARFPRSSSPGPCGARSR